MTPFNETMIKERFYPGIRIKNYKTLCELLELETQGGNAKKQQLAELERFMKYSRDGHAYIINEVFDSPTPRFDMRENPENRLITDALFTYILNVKSQKTIITKNSLFMRLGLMNQEYRDNSINRKEAYDLVKKMYPDKHYKWIVDAFFKRSKNMMINKTNGALNYLQNRKILKWENVLFKRTAEGEYEPVSLEEKTKIEEIKKDCLVWYGKKTISELIFVNQNSLVHGYDDFIETVNETLLDEMDIQFVYNVYEIRKCLKPYEYLSDIDVNLVDPEEYCYPDSAFTPSESQTCTALKQTLASNEFKSSDAMTNVSIISISDHELDQYYTRHNNFESLNDYAELCNRIMIEWTLNKAMEYQNKKGYSDYYDIIKMLTDRYIKI